MHCAVCLLILYFVAGASLAALETVCLKDSGTVFSYQLNYDENSSAVDLTATSNYVGNFTFAKIQLSAIWDNDITNPLCHEDRLFLHTVKEVSAIRNVCYINMSLLHVNPGLFS